ncbi:putative leucine-rich repeat receptor-like protein kinase IMK3 [Ananas comosus]|nr:putative leucine-rich repeat receptor-like protein kinase IMK3 [Ananas comosus]
MLTTIIISITPASSQSWDGIAITQADYQGLRAFRFALSDPRGLLRSWNGSGLDACSGSWDGIKCVRGKVIAIQLPYRGLGGRITEKIGQLTALRKLSLHDNAVGGQIPAALGLLTDLRGLYLFNNRFSGTIPPSVGELALLQTLDLSNNLLSGSIPSSIANSTKLYRLNLSHNNLSGAIPNGLTNLPSLTFLLIQHNNLSSSIPGTWGVEEPGKKRVYQLQVLSLDHNSLSGPIPDSITKLERLQELLLSNNQLNGSIPESIDGLRNLSILSLNRNSLSGAIPATVGNISSLEHLDFSENNLSGEIPASLEKLNNLTFFNVSYNNLSGPVPVRLSEKFNSSSFVGNSLLCGVGGSNTCANPAPTPPLNSPSPPSSTEPGTRRLNSRELILVVAGIAFLFFLLFTCVLLSCLFGGSRETAGSNKRGANAGATAAAAAAAAERGEKPGTGAAAAEAVAGGDGGGKLVHFDGPSTFTADDLLCATAEIMGKSTYGTVYKATLEDGSQVAVKRLREKIAKNQKEFETEVNAIGKVRHPNLLALRAYYLGPKGEKLLVFDYMPRGSLAAFLHARGPDTPIDWPMRMNIAIGVARGLHHLHTDVNMVHGNLTSSNILLDAEGSPKIADYGLSRLMSAAANSNAIATAGALGYRAPELSKLKKASAKTDVYSLGVVLLELLTGKPAGETTNGLDLPQWVASVVKEEWTNEVFDLELMREPAETGDELVNTLKLALHCVDPLPAARPDVHEVLRQLEEIKPELAAAPAGTASSQADH